MAIQTTLTGILSRLFPKLAKIVVGGTITTNSNASLFPTAISNEIMGGHHGLDTLADLANIPTNRLIVPTLATVRQHVVGGVIIPRTTYVLDVLPSTTYDRLTDVPGYLLSDYWKVFSSIEKEFGNIEVQYAPNINDLTGQVELTGNKPPFPASVTGIVITQAEYTGLTTGSNTAIASTGTQLPGYWTSNYDSTKGHLWKRQRFNNGLAVTSWGIPVKISESYEDAKYTSNIFIRNAVQPITPTKYKNGVLNNNPVGWTTTAIAGPFKLWMSTATKDAYNQLITNWSSPIEIAYFPALVRYSVSGLPDPNTLTYDDNTSLSLPSSSSLTSQGWIETFNLVTHNYRAVRTEISTGVFSTWTVIKIRDTIAPSGLTTLITDLNNQSFVNTGANGPNSTLAPGAIYQSSWSLVSNSLNLNRHLITKYSIKGYNNSSTNNSILISNIEFSTDATNVNVSVQDTGASWGESVEFGKSISGQAVAAHLSAVSVNRILANTTLYVRVVLTNSGGGTLVLNNFSLNTFLV